jgi:hypothetical protein
MVISYADYKMRMEDPRFPVGQARLEAIGVLACECAGWTVEGKRGLTIHCIMCVAFYEII